ncbi:TonB-dependent receptor plug domain-containing protein [uncultured Draconibacterium sp.]|uniref:TonB-dependent receptor plug domain-containing protein n=1 Tax=uncultured Draconibacterium sp. TaxID=1573823 RepID=UPI0032605168
MKTNLFTLFVVLFFVFGSAGVSAQERYIDGIVTTFDSIAVIGADVWVKSSKTVIKTDTLGRFKVAVLPGDKLKISARGFVSRSVKLEDKTKIVAVNLKLKPGDKSREYAIGYGYVKDGEKLNAVAQMTDDDVDFAQYSNMYDLIRGRFAGVQVAGGEIIIRGVNSINSSSAALIVVDGITTDGSILGVLSPAQVKSVNVIKDGGAAIYGSRGANGVVIIETKRGND